MRVFRVLTRELFESLFYVPNAFECGVPPDSATQALLRSYEASVTSMHGMAMNSVSHPERESFLLELLHFAGWRLEIRRGSSTRIRAARSGVELDVTGPSLSHAAGTVFARAMRSSRDTGRSEVTQWTR